MSTPIIHQTVYTFRDREFPRVPSELELADKIGSWKARWGMNRMNFTVEPGLYAVGNPDGTSPVMVSANYKMSFDHLRSSMPRIDSWILVLDTKGINVWCAAGKGTFATDELVKRITETKLSEIIDHRKIIVPQLGATGVSAHLVKKQSGFTVKYGPVRAADIPKFLADGNKSTPEMRRVLFTAADRLVLVPLELVMGLKWLFPAMIAVFLLAAVNGSGYIWSEHLADGLGNILYILTAYLVGSILGPLLLPYLPGRAFALKGFLLGLFAAIIIVLEARWRPLYGESGFSIYSWLLIVPAITSFILMNFTGASTYTSLSGVVKEMKIAMPVQISLAIGGLGLWLLGRFV